MRRTMRCTPQLGAGTLFFPFSVAKVNKTFELAKCLVRKSICTLLIWSCHEDVVTLRSFILKVSHH